MDKNTLMRARMEGLLAPFMIKRLKQLTHILTQSPSLYRAITTCHVNRSADVVVESIAAHTTLTVSDRANLSVTAS